VVGQGPFPPGSRPILVEGDPTFTGWSPTTLTPPPTVSASLDAVSCTDSTNCMATGTQYYMVGNSEATWQLTLIDSDGHWSTVPATDTPPTDLRSVRVDGLTCSGPDFCLEVGSNGHQRPGAWLWDGSRWSEATIPGASMPGSLQAASCTGPDFCMVVGGEGFGTTTVLIERWNGRVWTSVPTPPEATDPYLDLTDISCSDPDHCLAVGHGPGLARTELTWAWDGATWTATPAPEPKFPPLPADLPSGVIVVGSASCLSSTWCMVVWSSESQEAKGNALPATSVTAAQVWNGSSWSNLPTPHPPPDSGAFYALNHVSCASTSACVAVGAEADYPGIAKSQYTPGPRMGLIESWDGSAWTVSARG
jgi:hypothetical protein